MRHHVIISGTGRAGTTLLVQLCTALGLDTGFSSPSDGFLEHCSAGMEKDLSAADAPYVVKSPWLCEHLADILGARPDVVIDHAIVPVRTLQAAAESRRDVARRSGAVDGATVDGGLWGTSEPIEQEVVLARRFHDLLCTLALFEIPTTLLAFPRFVHDAEYLWRHLMKVFPSVPKDRFDVAVAAVVRPELVHNF